MFEATISRDVAAPVEKVWAVLIDLDRAPDVVTAITSVERLDESHGFDVGTKWRETLEFSGRQARQTQEVTALDPGRSYTVDSYNKRSHYSTTLELAPRGDDSTVRMTFTSVPNSVFGTIGGATVGRLFRGMTRRALEEHLADLATAAESDTRT